MVTEKTAAGTRYRQLETVRQFGTENLDHAGETAATGRPRIAPTSLPSPSPTTPNGPPGWSSNSRSCSTASTTTCAPRCAGRARTSPETALRLAASLWRFWFLRGHAVEGARWVERALAVAPDPTRPRAAALIGLTGLDSRQGRSDRHRALGAEALAIMRQIGEPDEVVMARIIEAMLAWSTFDLDEAEQMATEVRAEAIEGGRPEHCRRRQLAARPVRAVPGGRTTRRPAPRHLPERTRAVRHQHSTLPAGDHAEPATGPDRRTAGPLRRGDHAVGPAGRRHPGQRLRAVRRSATRPAFRRPGVGDIRHHGCGRAVRRVGR